MGPVLYLVANLSLVVPNAKEGPGHQVHNDVGHDSHAVSEGRSGWLLFMISSDLTFHCLSN